MSVQVCPVCNGRGLVPNGFYDTSYSSSSTAPEICRSCQGKGYLVIPDLTDSYYKVKSCSKCNKNDGLCYLSNPPQYKCTLDSHMYTSDHSCSKFEKYSGSLPNPSPEELKSPNILEKSSSFTTVDSPKLVICITDEYDNFPDISEYKNDEDCVIKCRSYFTGKEFIYSHSAKDWIQIL